MKRALRKYAAHRLKLPFPELHIKYEVWDGDGKLIYSKREVAHSWTRQIYNHIFQQAAGATCVIADGLGMKNTSGSIHQDSEAMTTMCGKTSGGTNNESYQAHAGFYSSGIQIGTGTAAVTFEDYALETLIANGTDPGEMSYIESEPVVVSTLGLVKTASIARFFNNNSGAQITVEEVALIAYLADCDQIDDADPAGVFMMARDLTGGVAVPDTGQLKVTYEVSLTYPS